MFNFVFIKTNINKDTNNIMKIEILHKINQNFSKHIV
jgi:hypothetical protein